VAGDSHSGVILSALSDFGLVRCVVIVYFRVISVVFRLAFLTDLFWYGGLVQCDLGVYTSEVFEAYLGYVLRCLG
jgi:hypothetical protein